METFTFYIDYHPYPQGAPPKPTGPLRFDAVDVEEAQRIAGAIAAFAMTGFAKHIVIKIHSNNGMLLRQIERP